VMDGNSCVSYVFRRLCCFPLGVLYMCTCVFVMMVGISAVFYRTLDCTLASVDSFLLIRTHLSVMYLLVVK